MLLKKSHIALCSSGELSSTFASLPVSSITSSNSPTSSAATATATATKPPLTLNSVWRTGSIHLPLQWVPIRFYATVNNDKQSASTGPDSAKNDGSPLPAWPATKNPTPYEIFHQTPSAPYDKKTYYQLVKLYHPDTNNHDHHPPSSASLTHAAKLERYRLVVDANNILSDPIRRRAYDLYGAGWGNKEDMLNARYREADRAWRQAPGSAAMNATWEDWQRWREEQDAHHGGTSTRKRQDPLYMSNGLFAFILAVFVVFASMGQASRAEGSIAPLVESREASSRQISEDMWKRRKEKIALTREDCIENFLRRREGWGEDARNESHLPAPKD